MKSTANWARHLHADASRIVLTLLRWRVTFRINYRQRESRSPETFIDTLLCVYGHTPGIMGLPGPLQPLFRLFALPAARVGPHFMLVMPLFPESVYYHRPVSSFMQNNLISRASKSRYNVVPCAPCFALSRFCPAASFGISPVPSPSAFKLTARENYGDSVRKLMDGDVAVVIWLAIITGFRSFDRYRHGWLINQ